MLKIQVEKLKVELADKSISNQAFVNLGFSRHLEKNVVAETSESDPEYILMIDVFQFRKFAIVGEKRLLRGSENQHIYQFYAFTFNAV